MPEETEVERLQKELFWMSQLVNGLVLRLGGNVAVTDEELRVALNHDASWKRVNSSGMEDEHGEAIRIFVV